MLLAGSCVRLSILKRLRIPSSIKSVPWFRQFGNMKEQPVDLGIRNRACQTRYRENETQTVPWHPPYIKGKKVPECVEFDPELKLKDLHFDQYDVDIVKRLRQRKDWEKYLRKLDTLKNADLQKEIVEQLEKEKWKFREKEIDDINEVRLELARKELEEQSAIIKERMEYRMNNSRNKYEELKRKNAQKYHVKLEREMRRTNFMLEKSNHYPHMKSVMKKVYNSRPQCLYKPKRQCEILCPEAIPSDLHDAYMMLERNLAPTKPFKKDYPHTHDCNIPQFHEIIDDGDESIEEKKKLDKLEALDIEKKKREKLFKNSKSLIAAVIGGRATQSMVHCKAKVDQFALYRKYNKGSKLYESGIREAEEFDLAVAEGIRDFNINMKLKEKVQGVIRRLEGRTISIVLDFISKEFIRLQEHRRLLQLADVAERHRWSLEAKEAGRRQEEEQRLKQHEEMYKEVMKTHEITTDTILDAILEDEVEKTGSGMAIMWTRVVADHYKDIFGEPAKGDPYRKLEYVSRLADRCLAPQSGMTSIKLQREADIKFSERVSDQIVDDLHRTVHSQAAQELDTEETEPSDEPDMISTGGTGDYDNKSTSADVGTTDDSSSGKSCLEELEENTSKAVEPSSPRDDEMLQVPPLLSPNEGIRCEKRVRITEGYSELEETAEELLNQIIAKAEHFVESYGDNKQKVVHSTDSLQKIYANSLSDAYQTLSLELLKIGSRKSKTIIKSKIHPWVNSVINEATRRVSSLIFAPSELENEQKDNDNKVIFMTDDFYFCPGEENVIHEVKENDEEEIESEETDLEQAKSLEYIGILDEKIDTQIVPDEDRLNHITKQNK